jgi:hypothetical protein
MPIGQTLTTTSLIGRAHECADHVVYIDNVSNGAGDLEEVVVPNTPPTTMIASKVVANPGYDPCNLTFQDNYDYCYVGYCPSPRPSTPYGASVAVYGGSQIGYMATDVSPTWGPWSDNNGSDLLFVAMSTGEGDVLDDTNYPPTVVGTVDTGVTGGLLTPDSQFAVYVAGGALKSQVQGGASLVQAMAADGIWRVSPASDSVLFHTSPLDAFGFGDVAIVPLGVTTPPRSLASGVVPIGYTSDGAYVALASAPDPTTGGGAFAYALAASGPAMMIAQNGTNLVVDPAPTPVLVFDDAFDGMHADVKSIQLQSGSPKTIAAGANVGFAVTATGDRVVYATDVVVPPQMPGIYTAPAF